MFESLAPSATGVSFTNTLPEGPDINILNYLYYYNGGGVAAGDVDGDGRPDLYFSSNLGKNQLYLNRGQYRFENVTERAGVGGPGGWKTGVTMADVNGDGRLDLYVSTVSYLTLAGRNALYINNGDGTFTDRAAEVGLDRVGYSTQALFFDYDRDGDLDVFLLGHSTHTERGIGQAKRDVRSPMGGGRLFRNDGRRFTDVSAAAGIYGGVEGFGLGIVATDYDGDGCLDVYVANDFQEQDFLYRNNCNGTFSERIGTATAHTSRFSMGVDAGDINNDGHPDIVSVDMMPEREDVLKTSASYEGWNLFNLRLQAGYHAQFARNTLQLNQGNGRFADVAFLAGVHATDWSWAPLFADFDNDGWQDLFITSGIYRRPNDLDYINYVGNDAQQAALAQGMTPEAMTLLKRMPQVPVVNHLYRNDGDLHFTDQAAAWGLGEAGISNGAVYADLDNTGTLDLVVSRINAPASIYRNLARTRNGHGFLSVALRGVGRNTGGIGARVQLYTGGTTQLREAVSTRGFQSSVDPRLHFGVGDVRVIDSLRVTWPSGRVQRLDQVAVNQQLVLEEADAVRAAPASTARASRPLFTDITVRAGLSFLHREGPSLDFDREPLMPRLLSRQGPALAVGDLTGDGLDDVFVGGAKWQPGEVWVQSRNGTFSRASQPEVAADSTAEDVDAALFDANGDGALDLLVVSGGNEFTGDAEQLLPRLYLNDGRGQLRRARANLPALHANGGCVAVGDFDRDGHPDLFLGSRVVSGTYGVTPTSHLLRNDGTGRFTEVTSTLAPALGASGMVSSAAWVDVDRDGALDLVVVGEWMPVRVFHQERGTFVDRTESMGLARTQGWWNRVRAADLDGDSMPELVLGNLGRNSYITATDSTPARLVMGDFQHNGTLEQVLTFYKQGVSYPMYGRDELLKLVPSLKPKFQSFQSFGASTLEDIFPAADLRAATTLEARTFSHAVARWNGRQFALQPLPTVAQLAPVYGIVVTDVDGDGRPDVVLGGNDRGVPPLQGWYDASQGLVLRGAASGGLTPLTPLEAGLQLYGDVRQMAMVRLATGGQALLVAQSDGPLTLLQLRRERAVRR
jgi:enediyne biosynthesis protein E4